MVEKLQGIRQSKNCWTFIQMPLFVTVFIDWVTGKQWSGLMIRLNLLDHEQSLCVRISQREETTCRRQGASWKLKFAKFKALGSDAFGTHFKAKRYTLKRYMLDHHTKDLGRLSIYSSYPALDLIVSTGRWVAGTQLHENLAVLWWWTLCIMERLIETELHALYSAVRDMSSRTTENERCRLDYWPYFVCKGKMVMLVSPRRA